MPTADSTDDELDTWMLRTASDAQHICGTARMGTGDDAVVDPACRVRGVDRLRVVDASVFPRVPRANTHLAVLAVAERAADLIRPALSPPRPIWTHDLDAVDRRRARPAASSPVLDALAVHRRSGPPTFGTKTMSIAVGHPPATRSVLDA